jgi:hypothetical protein
MRPAMTLASTPGNESSLSRGMSSSAAGTSPTKWGRAARKP